MNQKEVIKKLVERSWTDAQFKAEFVANPVAVIERETGEKVNLAKGREIVVMDQSDANTYYLNLSKYVTDRDFSNKELSDSQLEAVAGGADSNNPFTCKPKGCFGDWHDEVKGDDPQG